MDGFFTLIVLAMAAGAFVVLLTIPAAREARSRRSLHQHPRQ